MHNQKKLPIKNTNCKRYERNRNVAQRRRRGKKFGAALLQTRVFAAPHKKEDRPHPQQQ
jgi:hypothetical protein